MRSSKFILILEYPKTLRIDDLENSDIHTHNFEADIVLEKLDQEHEKVSQNENLNFSNFLLTLTFFDFFLSEQKQERSDSNNILGTYFRPRRAAELINQNKVLNCWKGESIAHFSLRFEFSEFFSFVTSRLFESSEAIK